MVEDIQLLGAHGHPTQRFICKRAEATASCTRSSGYLLKWEHPHMKKLVTKFSLNL